MAIVTETKSLTGAFTAEAFATHLATQSSAPTWWLDRKRAAYEKFAALPMPSRTDEGWRFSNRGTLTLEGFIASPSEAGAAVAGRPAFESAFALAFANNRLVSSAALPAELAANGVIVTTLTQALAKHSDLLRAHFMAQ